MLKQLDGERDSSTTWMNMNNEPTDQDGNFFTGLLVALSISAAIMWVFYNYAYSRGADSERCTRVHGYNFKKTEMAFTGGIKK